MQNNQRQHRISHAPKDVLPRRICANYCAPSPTGGVVLPRLAGVLPPDHPDGRPPRLTTPPERARERERAREGAYLVMRPSLRLIAYQVMSPYLSRDGPESGRPWEAPASGLTGPPHRASVPRRAYRGSSLIRNSRGALFLVGDLPLHHPPFLRRARTARLTTTGVPRP